MDAKVQCLLDNLVINYNQANYIEKSVQETQKTNTNYLFALLQSEFIEVTGYTNKLRQTQFTLSDDKVSEEQRLVINSELQKFLKNLKICELITDKQVTFFSKEIDSNLYSHKILLLQNITDKVVYREWIAPEKLLSFANELLDINLISNEKYNKLKHDVLSNGFDSESQLIKYCENAVIIDLSSYKDDIKVSLEEVFKSIASILPDLTFTDFTYSIIKNDNLSCHNSGDYDILVRLSIDEKIYYQKAFIAFTNDRIDIVKVDFEKLSNIFNKILNDRQSKYRLYTLNFTDKRLGFIALSQSQAATKVFKCTATYFQLNYQIFDSPTSLQIEHAVESYDKLGLLKHLDNEQIEKAIELIGQVFIQDFNDVLRCFQNVVYDFDTELANLENPYEELIIEYSNLSHGNFNPQNISDNFKDCFTTRGKKTILSFTLGEKTYSTEFKIDNDWIDTDYFNFMNRVVRENNLNGQFYTIDPNGQGVGIVYLTPVQYKYLCHNRIATFNNCS